MPPAEMSWVTVMRNVSSARAVAAASDAGSPMLFTRARHHILARRSRIEPGALGHRGIATQALVQQGAVAGEQCLRGELAGAQPGDEPLLGVFSRCRCGLRSIASGE